MDSILTVKDLVKKYGEKEVLHSIDLQVDEGEVLVVLGPSGCGKSTLLRCLNGLETIQSGEIRFDDSVIANSEKAWQKVRPDIGMVFQSYDLFPNRTVMENILLGPTKVQNRAEAEVKPEALKLLERVGLADRANDYPRQLSGGQKQRVAIVRALCMQPKLLLFDEVTASLDPEMVREVLEVIQGLAKNGMTMVIVTHEMSFASQVASRIIFMDEGRIIEESPGNDFFTHQKTERAKEFLSSLEF